MRTMTIGPQNTPVQVRIGLHTGSVVAGVIGTQKFAYDMWGDTVNVASRMEHSGQAGRIHVSEAVVNSIESAIESAMENAIENRESKRRPKRRSKRRTKRRPKTLVHFALSCEVRSR
jgi:class 3 adenylate cyclase